MCRPGGRHFTGSSKRVEAFSKSSNLVVNSVSLSRDLPVFPGFFEIIRVVGVNNLKTVNDTMGHSAGNQLILNFAKLLRSVIPEKDFVGRYGGDEFIAVIYHTSEAEIKVILKSLYREKNRLNSYENQIPIDYACGWALSSDDMSGTMQMLLDEADAYMYKNKQLCKKYN